MDLVLIQEFQHQAYMTNCKYVLGAIPCVQAYMPKSIWLGPCMGMMLTRCLLVMDAASHCYQAAVIQFIPHALCMGLMLAHCQLVMAAHTHYYLTVAQPEVHT